MNWKKDKNLIIGIGVVVVIIIVIILYCILTKYVWNKSDPYQRNVPDEYHHPIEYPPPPPPSNVRQPHPPHPPPVIQRPPMHVEKPPNARQNTETLIGDGRPALVLFHSDHCGHCKHMMGDWETAKQQLLSSNQYDVLSFEHGSFPDESKKNNIQGFPTIRYYPNGYPSGDHVEYKGNRSSDSMVKFTQSGGSAT